MINPGIILIWPGANAAIPSGYVRETSLDGIFPKAWGSEAVTTTGGASTHTHTSPSHSHVMDNHTHTYNLPQYSGGTEDEGDGSGGSRFADEVHTHSGTSGAVSGGGLTGSATIGTGSNLPPYYDVIFIRAVNYSQIPDLTIIQRADTVIPNGFAVCDGTLSTPNLNGKYLRGADTDADAGTTGGTLNHTHTYNHGHSAASHSHVAAKSGQASNGQSGDNQEGSGNGASGVHRHNVTLSSASTSVNDANGSFVSQDVEPGYVTLRANQNISGNRKLPSVGDIALWLGSEATVPVGWVICNGANSTPDLRDKFVKISNVPGSTGGSHTHTHSGVASHTHTATGTHNHSGGTDSADDTNMTGVGSHSVSIIDHTHSPNNVSQVTATWQNSTINADSSDNQPPYQTAIYVQFRFFAGGSVLAEML